METHGGRGVIGCDFHSPCPALSRSHAGFLLEFLLEGAAVGESADIGDGLVGPVAMLADDALGLLDAQL